MTGFTGLGRVSSITVASVRSAASSVQNAQAPAKQASDPVRQSWGGLPPGLSSQALFALAGTRVNAATEAQIATYRSFFPAREGFDTTALAAAAIDPSSVSSSADKSIDEVAADARARMDAKYLSMQGSGQPFGWASVEGRDRNALFGDLDRRSLLAVRENVGGLFSSQEQEAARSLMSQQQGLGMGLYSGPTSQQARFHDPYAESLVSRFRAAAAWLDSVSVDEKRTGEWIQQRSAVSGSLRNALYSGEQAEVGPLSLLDILMEADRQREPAGFFDLHRQLSGFRANRG